MGEKELLRKLGEETIYSAKGHFKSVDLRRIQTRWTIVICFIVNIVGLVGINQGVDKWLAAVGLLGTLFLFYWDAEEGKDYKAKHKSVAEDYLAIHKEIRECYMLSECSTDIVKKLGNKVSSLDRSIKPDIPVLARKWAKSSIENYDETDNWFLKRKS